VSEPHLRCLLCDLILADATTAGQPTERCRQCGRDILAGQAVGGADPIPVQPLGRREPITVVEELPEATVVMDRADSPPPSTPRPAEPADVIPTAGVAKAVPPPEVPTVQPRPQPSAVPPSLARRTGAPQTAASKPVPPLRKAQKPDPGRPTVDRPRPKIVIAFGVLGCMTLLVIVCIATIAYAILYGLQKARKVEAPASPRPAFSVPG
jgi:hypothetical protein